MRAVVVCACLVAVALAGCADEAGSEGAGAIDRETFEFALGQGAIAGLLVDDRFRPIELTDDPQTEFQTTGFVLLQETGQQVQTTENGEFNFVDLEPGTYTVRVTLDGHEATPQRVSVSAGEFTELSVVARRIAGEQGIAIAQEYTGFIACSVFFIAQGTVFDCTFDGSGDTDRASYDTDWTHFGDDATHLVTEARFNHVSTYAVQVRAFPETGRENYAGATPKDVDYVRIHLEHGVLNEEWTDPGPNVPWVNAHPFQTIMFALGEFHHEFAATGLVCCGVGVKVGTQAQFVQTLFLGDPEIDVEAYCVLC